jgi:1-deoxy-D-xylulose-5-phosphate synthase
VRFLKPIDTQLLHEAASRFAVIITVEDGALNGGLGSAVAEFMKDNGYHTELIRLGIPDSFIEHGTIPELHALCGYDAAGIEKAVRTAALGIKAKPH